MKLFSIITPKVLKHFKHTKWIKTLTSQDVVDKVDDLRKEMIIIRFKVRVLKIRIQFYKKVHLTNSFKH